jgi:hypothetical protein
MKQEKEMPQVRKLFAEVVNPSGHKVTIESRGYPTIEVGSAYTASGPQRYPVRDEAHFEHLKSQIYRALPFCKAISVTLVEEGLTPVVTFTVTAVPDPVVADGTTSAAITVSVLADGNPSEGTAIELSSTLGALSATSGVSDTNGQLVVTLTASEAGEATVTAVVDGKSEDAKVTFTAAPQPQAAPAPAKAKKPKAETPTAQE